MYSVLLSMLTMRPAADRFTVHAGAGALATSTKHSGTDRVSGQLFRGDAVLALAGLAEDLPGPRWLRPRP
jgi:hypothetical protein